MEKVSLHVYFSQERTQKLWLKVKAFITGVEVESLMSVMTWINTSKTRVFLMRKQGRILLWNVPFIQ